MGQNGLWRFDGKVFILRMKKKRGYFDFVQIQINNNKTMTKTMTNLTKKVKLDIEDFFKNIGASKILLNNELHLQMLLAQHLQNKGYRIFSEKPKKALIREDND